MVEKTINIKVKSSFQPLLKTRKINSRYLKCYKLAKKDKTNNDN